MPLNKSPYEHRPFLLPILPAQSSSGKKPSNFRSIDHSCLQLYINNLQQNTLAGRFIFIPKRNASDAGATALLVFLMGLIYKATISIFAPLSGWA